MPPPRTPPTPGDTDPRRPAGLIRTRCVVLAAVVLAIGAVACSSGDEPESLAAGSATTQLDGATTDPTTAPAGEATHDTTANPSGDDPTTTSGSATGDTTASTAPRDPTTALPDANAPDVTTSVFWVRPAGGEPRTFPGYADPDGQPTPLLVFGSVTNDGSEAIADPRASAVWRTPTGEIRVTTVATLRTADGDAVTTLEPGQTATVFAVVSDASSLAALADLAPELVVAGS